MAKDRLPSFQFYPRDFIASTAVDSMSPEELGGYIRLLCHAWMQERPGWLPDDDPLLARLSRLGERWPECRSAIRRAFIERDGCLVQLRMTEERDSQRQRYSQALKGALVTNEKRWSKVAQRPDSESHSDRPSVTPASASALESKEEERMVPAAAFARAKRLFPTRDIELIEAKLLDYHSQRPYKSLGRALISWCSRAMKQDSEALADRLAPQNGVPATNPTLPHQKYDPATQIMEDEQLWRKERAL